jgi:hypothetical protein
MVPRQIETTIATQKRERVCFWWLGEYMVGGSEIEIDRFKVTRWHTASLSHTLQGTRVPESVR